MLMLFIYGTLRDGARNRHVIDPFINWWEAASASGRLFLHDKYPLFFPGDNGDVVGELVELENEGRALARLDKFEGPEYRRIEIDVTIKDGGGKAWVYVYYQDVPPANAQHIESGDWLEFGE